MKDKDYWVQWGKAAGIRAIKTFAQSCLAGIAVGAAASEINWLYLLSVGAVAAVASLLTSIAGLPEVEVSEEN